MRRNIDKSQVKGYIYIFIILVVMVTLFYALFKLNNLQIQKKAEEFEAVSINQNQETQSGSLDCSIKDTLDSNNQELIDSIDVCEEVVTFAVFGTDERSTETARSDIIMVIKYYPLLDELTLISVPRDTRVYVEGYDVDKINSAYAYGGPELAQLMLETLFNIQIDYYIKFSFDDFKTIIDSLGGVKVNAAKDFANNGKVKVVQGEQILNGDDALYYVRYRSDEDGDFGRIKRQQEVIESLAHIVKEYDSESINGLVIDWYKNNMVTSITVEQLIDYLKLMRKDIPSFDKYTLKTTSLVIDGIWFEIIDDKELSVLKEILQK